jgi:hypothetical protein
MDTSKYVGACKAFLKAYPFRTTLTAVALLQWATEQGNGSNVFAADLAIDDPGKRLNAIRRHLNDGCRVGDLPENERFVLQIDDRQLKTYFVQPYADMAIEFAAASIGTSVTGALRPLNRSQKIYDSIAVEELSDEDKAELEGQISHVLAMQEAIKPVLGAEVRRIATAEWRKLGLTNEQAEKALRGLPVMNRLQKLLDMTK